MFFHINKEHQRNLNICCFLETLLMFFFSVCWYVWIIELRCKHTKTKLQLVSENTQIEKPPCSFDEKHNMNSAHYNRKECSQKKWKKKERKKTFKINKENGYTCLLPSLTQWFHLWLWPIMILKTQHQNTQAISKPLILVKIEPILQK